MELVLGVELGAAEEVYAFGDGEELDVGLEGCGIAADGVGVGVERWGGD